MMSEGPGRPLNTVAGLGIGRYLTGRTAEGRFSHGGKDSSLWGAVSRLSPAIPCAGSERLKPAELTPSPLRCSSHEGDEHGVSARVRFSRENLKRPWEGSGLPSTC